MIIGVGTDLIDISRIEQSLVKFGVGIAKKILGETEWLEFQKISQKAPFLAKRFAAKEAFVKALGTGFRQGITFAMVEVSHDALGKPFVILRKKAKNHSEILGVKEIFLSLSDEKTMALAFVVLTG